MNIKEVADKIIGILEARTVDIKSRLLGGENFYTGSPPKFCHEHVEFLLKLESKIGKKDSKDFFWACISYPILHSGTAFKIIGYQLPPTKVSKIINAAKKNSDVCLMVHLRANKIDDALDCLIRKWSSKGSPLISIEPVILRCLKQVLDNEPYQSNSKQLDKIEKCIQLCRSMINSLKIIGYQDIQTKKDIDYELQLLGKSFIQSRYQLIKKELEFENIEINLDKELVQNEINKFGFSDDLNKCLNRFEDNYRKAKDEFDFKETMGHIRSFMELLIEQIAGKVKNISQVPSSHDFSKFGGNRSYLKRKDVKFLDPDQDNLLGNIYKFISGTGVHTIKSQRECARLAKNITIEWALFLFRRLEKYSEDCSPQHTPSPHTP